MITEQRSSPADFVTSTSRKVAYATEPKIPYSPDWKFRLKSGDNGRWDEWRQEPYWGCGEAADFNAAGWHVAESAGFG